MGDETNLRAAESLITSYYEISKIRGEAERIKQFVEIDKLLKEYYEREIIPRERSRLRLSFTQKHTGRAGFKVYSLHDIVPASGQEKDLLKFTQQLATAMGYTALPSIDDGERA